MKCEKKNEKKNTGQKNNVDQYAKLEIEDVMEIITLLKFK